MSDPQIDLRPAQQYLGISGKITDGVPAFVDRAFPELFGWLREHAVEPAGPPFLRYDEVDSDGQPVELEVGVPVDAHVPASVAANGDSRVHADALPAGRYLTYLHVGPYRSETLPDLAAARERLLHLGGGPRAGTAQLHRALPHRPGRGAGLHEVGDGVRVPDRLAGAA